MIKISIIIPSYNDDKVIKLVESLLKKTKSLNYEIIVAESGCLKYSKKLSSKIIFIKSKKGRAIQMNKGAKESQGEYLLFLHSDSKIQKIDFKDLRESKINNKWYYFKLKFDSKKLYFRFIEFTSRLRAKIFNIPFGDQGLLISKKLFNKVRGFESESFEDINIALKLNKIKKPEIINQVIITSPRRFIEHGIIITHMTMGIILISYLLGLKEFAKHAYKLIR